MSNEKVTHTITSGTPGEPPEMEITITGDSSIRFSHDDLTLEAALRLLRLVDVKEFAEVNQEDDFYNKMIEIKSIVNVHLDLDEE